MIINKDREEKCKGCKYINTMRLYPTTDGIYPCRNCSRIITRVKDFYEPDEPNEEKSTEQNNE